MVRDLESGSRCALASHFHVWNKIEVYSLLESMTIQVRRHDYHPIQAVLHNADPF